MSTIRANGTAFVVMLLSLPLIAFGTLRDVDALWVVGLALLAAALVVPTATRWLDGNADESDS